MDQKYAPAADQELTAVEATVCSGCAPCVPCNGLRDEELTAVAAARQCTVCFSGIPAPRDEELTTVEAMSCLHNACHPGPF